MTLSPPTRRVILLGASNLTRSFATIVNVARRTWDEPIEIMAAMGHGRSYGQDSTIFGRKIPGIFPCALWQDLQRRPPLRTAALVTDIGNDLLYGVPPERVLEWVALCLDRLAEAGASTVVTQLPIDSVEQLGNVRYRFFRRVLFPRSALTLPAARQLVHTLNQGLITTGKVRKVPVIPVSATWYGLDPIHLKRRVWRHAWPEILAGWRDDAIPVSPSRTSWWTSAQLKLARPAERAVLGVARRAAQPCRRFSDGTTISLY